MSSATDSDTDEHSNSSTLSPGPPHSELPQKSKPNSWSSQCEQSTTPADDSDHRLPGNLFPKHLPFQNTDTRSLEMAFMANLRLSDPFDSQPGFPTTFALDKSEHHDSYPYHMSPAYSSIGARDGRSSQPYPVPGHTFSTLIYTDDASTKLSDRVRRRCFNCCTTDTSTWRRSSLSPGQVLCNKCGLFERTHGRSRPEQFPHRRGPLATSSTMARSRTPPESMLPPPTTTGIQSWIDLPSSAHTASSSCEDDHTLPLRQRSPTRLENDAVS